MNRVPKHDWFCVFWNFKRLYECGLLQQVTDEGTSEMLEHIDILSMNSFTDNSAIRDKLNEYVTSELPAYVAQLKEDFV